MHLVDLPNGLIAILDRVQTRRDLAHISQANRTMRQLGFTALLHIYGLDSAIKSKNMVLNVLCDALQLLPACQNFGILIDSLDLHFVPEDGIRGKLHCLTRLAECLPIIPSVTLNFTGIAADSALDAHIWTRLPGVLTALTNRNSTPDPRPVAVIGNRPTQHSTTACVRPRSPPACLPELQS